MIHYNYALNGWIDTIIAGIIVLLFVLLLMVL